MSEQDSKFLSELLSVFRVEAEEHLQAITSGLLKLEKAGAPDASVVETVFREAHSLKGAARAVDLREVGSLCQGMESVFSALKQGRIDTSAELFDVLHRALDGVRELLDAPQGHSVPLSELLSRLAWLERAPGPGDRVPVPPASSGAEPGDLPAPALPAAGDVLVPAEPESSEYPAPVSPGQVLPLPANGTGAERRVALETVRVSTRKLDDLLLQAEEMIALKPAMGQRVAELQEILGGVDLWKKRWRRLRPEMRQLKAAVEKQQVSGETQAERASIEKLLEFTDSCGAYLQQLEASLVALATTSEANYRGLSMKVDFHLEEMKKAVMLPASSLLESFPRMVRDLCRERGKEAHLEILGGDVEMDRRVLEGLKDPLIHLVRNAIDHGIETPSERMAKGKPRQARLAVTFSPRDGNKVELVVTDDGTGIDLARVSEVAARKGITGNGANDQEAISLIFRSEVSTSPIVTELSGRGLGLAIVQEKVERLGGQVAVKTRPGEGTTFTLLLPLTLATFRGVLVEAGGRLFVVPTSAVQRAVRVKAEEINSAGNRRIICVEGRNLPYVRLESLLEIPESPSAGERELHLAIVIQSQEMLLALGVDEILREEEVLVKGLGRQLLRVRNIAGATVLGTGQVAPILNVSDLMKTGLRRDGHSDAVVPPRKGEVRKKTVLVAEDSITSRMLLKNLLESAGYQVRTAVDGSDAWSTLHAEPFDAVVSDVQMPRMDGFELTRKIRGEKNLAEMPVVLVTSLDSREDKERGIEAGASAYIVKSSFDQNNLLSVLRRLL